MPRIEYGEMLSWVNSYYHHEYIASLRDNWMGVVGLCWQDSKIMWEKNDAYTLGPTKLPDNRMQTDLSWLTNDNQSLYDLV